MYTYKAIVRRWIDGDTVELEVDLGFHVKILDQFRLAGVNTPELRPRKADFDTEEDRQKEIAAAKLAKEYCETSAPSGSEVTIETSKEGKFGRWIAIVYINGDSINDALITEGYAKPY